MGFTVITSAASHHRVARRREEPRLCGFGLGPSDSGGGRFAITGLTGALFLAGRYQKVASSVVASVSFPRASRTKNLGNAFSQHYDDIAELSTIAVMCCFTPKSDIHRQGRNVRFVPKADIAPPTRSPRRREQA